MNSIELLTQTKSLIANPDNWIKKKNAISAKGREVKPDSNRACKFCVLGAFDRVSILNNVSYSITKDAIYRLENEVKQVSDFRCVHWYNDAPKTTHSDVIAILDNAIQTLSGEQQ